MSAPSLDYLAGLFDGEGSITVGDHLCVQVEMADQAAVQLFADRWGGNLRTRQRDTRRPTWTWKATTRRAAVVLSDLRPYLRSKAPQADLGLAYQERMRPSAPGQLNKTTDDERAVRAEMAARMSDLNRGRAAA